MEFYFRPEEKFLGGYQSEWEICFLASFAMNSFPFCTTVCVEGWIMGGEPKYFQGTNGKAGWAGGFYIHLFISSTQSSPVLPSTDDVSTMSKLHPSHILTWGRCQPSCFWLVSWLYPRGVPERQGSNPTRILLLRPKNVWLRNFGTCFGV